MRLWETGSAAFFVYVILVALLQLSRRRAARARDRGRDGRFEEPLIPRGPRRAAAGASAGLAATLISSQIPAHPVLHGWLLPPILLLLAYWSSGALFIAPMLRVERLLAAVDRRFGVPAASRSMPGALIVMLESAYAGVYPLIPLALALRMIFVPEGDAERFWAVVLFTDFVCFGMLPWIQTRPPRALEEHAPWASRIRAFNLRLLGSTSIHVNTFPSGHAAEAMAAALLVIGAPAPVVVGMFAAALAVSAGAVFGRYHYALDALAGWAVAAVVWVQWGQAP